MSVQRLDHYNLVTTKKDETLDFYLNVMGFGDGSERRKASGAVPPGIWFLVGAEQHPAVHCNFVEAQDDKNGESIVQEPSEVINHMAFAATDLKGFEERLQRLNVKFDKAVRSNGVVQLYVRDPNNIKIEIQFESADS